MSMNLNNFWIGNFLKKIKKKRKYIDVKRIFTKIY